LLLPDGSKLVDSPQFPKEYFDEASQQITTLESFRKDAGKTKGKKRREKKAGKKGGKKRREKKVGKKGGKKRQQKQPKKKKKDGGKNNKERRQPSFPKNISVRSPKSLLLNPLEKTQVKQNQGEKR
jgi:hypothetical protein